MHTTSILANYVYIDLEVNKEEEVYRIGLVSDSIELDDKITEVTQDSLELLHEQGLQICGHNFRQFDYPYLITSFPTLQSWLVIDTLELSILSFPLAQSHKLNKEYKLSDYAANNPHEDALATRKLLESILHSLNNKPQKLLNFYAYLFSCGEDEVSQAYRQFFSSTGYSQPVINELPAMAIDGIDIRYLDEFITQASAKDFYQRLCVAGIVAWNYESNSSNSKHPLSGWLNRLSDCATLLNKIKPVKFPREFTYHPYLREFGNEQFRPYQEEAIQAILDKKNPLVLMATAGGKSLCYQLPALMLSRRQLGLTVVISPLQALMEDQANGLMEKGLNFATFINGLITVTERRERLEQVRNGEKDLLYISAEQLRSPSIRVLLQERHPSLIVFDEAHCISQWGHDFRPDYRYAPKFIAEIYRDAKREFPLMAFMTATATIQVRQDIKDLFAKYGIVIQTEICTSSVRHNLKYRIIPTNKQDKEQLVVEQVQNAMNGQSGAVLIYTSTRKNTERLSRLLNQKQIEARFYHGKIPKDDKREILEKFKARELDVIVATCAFGMGIDRADVRAVIHHTISGNLEGYVQEAGRAGRDGKDATCTLLFDPKDADTVFFLQSLNQLSEPELRNLFIAVRKVRNDIFGVASEEYFWVTVDEIFQTSDLDEKFAVEDDQRETKIKVALHYLETFQMLEREENQSSFFEFELVHDSAEDSLKAFDSYASSHALTNEHKTEFQKLILAMHRAKAFCQNRSEPYPLEKLSDEAGIDIKKLKQYMKELHKAEVCTAKVPITLLITKIDRGNQKNDTRIKYAKHRELETKIADRIVEKIGEDGQLHINCRWLATDLDPEHEHKLSAGKILEILEGWKFLKWSELQQFNRDIVKITKFFANEHIKSYGNFIQQIIEALYTALKEENGTRLRLVQDLNDLLVNINQRCKPLNYELDDLEQALTWMHKHKLVRIADGVNLSHQSMKVKVIKGVREDKITSEYPTKVIPHYNDQTRRTHIMLDYGEKHKQKDFNLQEYIADYFSLPRSEFSRLHPHTDGDAAKRPVTQEDYDRIIIPLNPVQREIVLSESPAISVIAGPGSGKTRTIVHRIAYLVKVKRVDPARIITLAYNRNAVREIRLRLQDLVGEVAARLRVYTFHGLALSILGRTVTQSNNGSQSQQSFQDPNTTFEKLIEDACDFLDKDEDDTAIEHEPEDKQARLIKLLGSPEFIFVDEYQDVAEQEYRLVKLIAGLQQPMDKAKSVQTNICIIGDDDQNIYEWRGTSTQYIRSFEVEYQAKQFLLTENYRSSEPIIAASNRLIRNNPDRLKSKGNEQVRIDSERLGQGGLDVHALRFKDDNQQAEYIKRQVEKWIKEGVRRQDIAILARKWEYADKVRALLDRNAGIPTYSLASEAISLTRNLITQFLLAYLEENLHSILPKEESVKNHFETFFQRKNRNLFEPTVKTLLKISEDIDKERGYGAEEVSSEVAVSEIVTSIYEFNQDPSRAIDPDAVLVTSCHGAKGLEFKYVILIADGFNYNSSKIESERRLFYVAMTRAKEKLILTHTEDVRFVQEAEATPYPIQGMNITALRFVSYTDLTPKDVNLGFPLTQTNQSTIKQLKEGDPIDLKPTKSGDNWTIRSDNQIIGLLSKYGVKNLSNKGIIPNQFTFNTGEVTVKNVYRHLEIDEASGKILEEWYVVIPQIRVCR